MSANPSPAAGALPGLDLTMERHFRASPQAVWRAWTDPAQLGRWFGPATFRNDEVAIEARAGAPWRLVMVSPDGARFPLHGRVLEADAPRRLVLEMLTDEHPAEWHGMVSAATGRAAGSPIVIVLTVELHAEGDGTRMRASQRFSTPEEAEGMRGLGAERGWSQGHDRLELVLAGAATPPDMIVLSRTLNAPRERAWAAFSRPEALDAWWGPDGFVTKTESMSLEVGGSWIFTMTHPEWGTHPNRVRYLEVVAPERLHFLHDGGEGTRGFYAWIWLEDLGDGTTRISLCQRHPSAEVAEHVRGFGAVELGYQTLAHLAAHIER